MMQKEGGGTLWAAIERHGEELGPLGPEMHERGRFSAQNPESSSQGLITVICVK